MAGSGSTGVNSNKEEEKAARMSELQALKQAVAPMSEVLPDGAKVSITPLVQRSARILQLAKDGKYLGVQVSVPLAVSRYDSELSKKISVMKDVLSYYVANHTRAAAVSPDRLKLKRDQVMQQLNTG